MKLHSTNAFVIYAKKMNEADLLLGYVTEDYGRITCFANNARKSRKRFLGKLEPAMLTKIKFYEKPGMTIDILYEVELVEDYKNIRKDIDAYLFISKIIEISRVLCQERDKNKNIFKLIRSVYSGLNGITDARGMNNINTILLKYEIYFISHLLRYNGIFPNFTSCTACSCANRHNNFYFSLKKGGVVCKDCAESEVRRGNQWDLKGIPVNFINLSELMSGSDISITNKLVVSDEILRECLLFLGNFLSFHTGNKLNYTGLNIQGV